MLRKNWKKLTVNIFKLTDNITYLTYWVNEKGIFAVIKKPDYATNSDSIFLLFTSNLGATWQINKFLNKNQSSLNEKYYKFYQVGDYVYLNIRALFIYLKIDKRTLEIENRIVPTNSYILYTSTVAEYIFKGIGNNYFMDIKFTNGTTVTKPMPRNTYAYADISMLKDSLLYQISV